VKENAKYFSLLFSLSSLELFNVSQDLECAGARALSLSFLLLGKEKHFFFFPFAETSANPETRHG